jgi:hypothetical protein
MDDAKEMAKFNASLSTSSASAEPNILDIISAIGGMTNGQGQTTTREAEAWNSLLDEAPQYSPDATQQESYIYQKLNDPNLYTDLDKEQLWGGWRQMKGDLAYQ